MRISKKVIVYLLVVSFLLIPAMLTLAAPENPIAPDKGDLYIHKYRLEDISLAGEGTGTTQDEQQIPEGAEKLGGVAFDVYRIGSPGTGSPEVPAGGAADYILKTDSSGLPPGINAAPYLEVNKAGAITYHNLQLINPASHSAQAETDSLGVIHYTDLPKGYYLVVEDAQKSDPWIGSNSNKVSVSGIVAPFLVSVPMLSPTEDSWIEEVHVYPKNPPLTIEKTVDRQTVSIGDEVMFTITIPKIPDTISADTVKSFVVSDPLNLAFKLKRDTTLALSDVTIKVMNNNGQHITGVFTQGVVLENKEDYNDSGEYDYAILHENESLLGGGTLSVMFTKTGREKLGAVITSDNAKSISIDFTVVVNVAILEVTGEGGNPYHSAGNKSKVEMISGANTFSDESENKLITTSEIIARSVDERGNPLLGVKFILGRYLEGESMDNATYYTQRDSIVAWSVNREEATEKPVSDMDGIQAALFAGVSRHDNAAPPLKYRYFLIQTDVPDGYNLLGSPVEFWIVNDQQEGNVTFDNDDLTATVQIRNTTKFTLPITGGIGTILFIVTGIVLIGAGIAFLVSSKKRTVH